MMKVLVLAVVVAGGVAYAQPTKAPPASSSPTPNVCDVSYSIATETMDQQDVGTAITSLKAVPWPDVQDNHQKNLKILNELSKQQDKGGPYAITVTETQTCDGGATVRISDGSAYVEGVTLDGSNKVTRVALQQADQIVKRYEDREKQGAKQAWNHKNAKKVKRNEFGQRVDN